MNLEKYFDNMSPLWAPPPPQIYSEHDATARKGKLVK